MEYVIGAVLVAIAILLIIAYFNRNKVYKEIDELDEKKQELTERPVADELSKVKALNLTGQTEELFDRWRHTWDDVLLEDIVQADGYLLEAERRADWFKFKKARASNEAAARKLEEAEKKIDLILSELGELIGSEENNRVEREELKEKQRIAKKRLLAHRHTFGKAAAVLEEQLESLSEGFQTFEDLTKEGNYLEAREVILKLKESVILILRKMELIPLLMAETTNLLPSQLNEIESGYKEMKHQGYLLDHLQLEKEIASLRKQLNVYKDFIVKTEIDEVEAGIRDVKENIDFFYELLEKEVEAKHFLVTNHTQTRDLIEEARVTNEELQEETEHVRQTYELTEEEWSVPKQLEEDIYRLGQRYDILETRISEQKTAYSFLHDELKEIQIQLQELQKEQASFSSFLKTLRKDEIEAREKINELRKKVTDIFRVVDKSNIPGVPDFYEVLTEETVDRIKEAQQSLKETPLNIKSVQEKLKEAIASVDGLERKTAEVVEQAELAERMIQYGNRYKRSHPAITEKLQQAERAFRNYDYRSALEEAATAIHKVDPKGLKQLEKMMNKKEQ
ncbi:septation ring formation regulator EzrA [Bacillus thermotolerans]|uniref:Septation ring formation regulator EzrA n=1 Tax=Bacillus thermotolerans TaxID=1221996 RepID=A0A0F5HXK7_BACTR|nr:septation ring formation regulator EzrA [Bacillus thermotolerans]KKB37572.1 Septation ring formation regulator EzrA [Bacillus thermotolerans]KKB42199.1 Septation ring formation regulator EzrA [Bacillus thermotolerans]KKB43271.1 Septation ring formation regulator EzrA [Bacillus thermotolerans]